MVSKHEVQSSNHRRSRKPTKENGPTPMQVRSNLEDNRNDANSLKAWSLFLAVAAVYVVSFYGMLVLSWYFKPLAMVVNGVSIACLFIIGHDCGHRSYFRGIFVNIVMGQVCCLPSYWILRTWQVAHNHFHHAFACLKTKDHSWVPTDVKEYQQLNWLGRLYVRHSRTWLGLSTYWLYSIWWRHCIVPTADDWSLILRKKSQYIWETVAVTAFLATQIVAIAWYTRAVEHASLLNTALCIVAYLGVPFWVYGFFVGLVSMVQHTHPNVVWFKDMDEWTFFSGQVYDAVHFKFPFPLSLLFLDVMEHTAHHVDTGTPIYNLVRQQERLEQAYPDCITVETYSIETVNRIFKSCQLYNYDEHCWMTFDGSPTTPPRNLDQLVPAAKPVEMTLGKQSLRIDP